MKYLIVLIVFFFVQDRQYYPKDVCSRLNACVDSKAFKEFFKEFITAKDTTTIYTDKDCGCPLTKLRNGKIINFKKAYFECRLYDDINPKYVDKIPNELAFWISDDNKYSFWHTRSNSVIVFSFNSRNKPVVISYGNY